MIGEHNEWEIEEWFYANKCGIDPETAHIFVILRWMSHGDFRPLAAAIRKPGDIDDAILAAYTAWRKARDKLIARQNKKPQPLGQG